MIAVSGVYVLALCALYVPNLKYDKLYHGVLVIHSIETPNMVGPQWNILYWRSKWIFQAVCWDAVGCEWGTTSIYFGITYVWCFPSRLFVFAVGPQCQHLYFCQEYHLKGTYKIFEKNPCRFKTWMGYVGQIFNKLGTSSFWCFRLLPFGVLFGVTNANMLVVIQWPLKHAPHLTLLPGLWMVWGSEISIYLHLTKSHVHNIPLSYQVILSKIYFASFETGIDFGGLFDIVITQSLVGCILYYTQGDTN